MIVEEPSSAVAEMSVVPFQYGGAGSSAGPDDPDAKPISSKMAKTPEEDEPVQ